MMRQKQNDTHFDKMNAFSSVECTDSTIFLLPFENRIGIHSFFSSVFSYTRIIDDDDDPIISLYTHQKKKKTIFVCQ